MKTVFLGLTGVIIVYVSYVLVHTGAFRPVGFEVIEGPPFPMIYKEHTGPYHEISSVISEVEQWLASVNVGCRRSFGLFLDNPEVVEESRLRSYAGCMSHHQLTNEEKQIKYQELPAHKYLKAEFSGSPAIGPYKVYPKAMEKIKEARMKLDGPILEVYSLHSGEEMKTEYFFPVSDSITADESN